MRDILKQSIATASILALMVGPVGTSAAAAQDRVEVGNAAAVVGDVTMRVNGEGKKQEVERKDRFAWGDLVSTGKKSQLQILLLDRSTFGMGASSQVSIDRYVYDPEAGRSAFVSFLKGALRFFSGRQEGDNSAEVQTPAGRIGIRGTAVDMMVGKDAEKIAENEEFVGNVDSDKDEATLVVLRGPGAATEGGLTPGVVDVEGAGVTVTLDAPGLAAYIPRAGAAPIGPFSISNKGLSKVQDEMAPEVARATKGGGLLETLIPIAVGAIVLGKLLDGGDDNNTPTRPTGTSPNDNGDVQRPPSDPISVTNVQTSAPRPQSGNNQTSSTPPPDPQR